MKYLLWLFGWCVVVVWWCMLSSSEHMMSQISQVCSSEACVEVELADTPELRQRGLMFREYLPEWSGMLFVFDEEWHYPFWMKNTLIPLDMIWFNEDKIVVDIQRAEPCTTDQCPEYVPRDNASYVLEINSGWVSHMALSIWSHLKFK